MNGHTIVPQKLHKTTSLLLHLILSCLLYTSRVAAYARVSSDSADQLNSFATQVAYYTDFIQSKDEWEFAGLYADEAVSGTTADKRDDFQRLLADCRAGKIDRILVKSISRFARNTLDCLQTDVYKRQW